MQACASAPEPKLSAKPPQVQTPAPTPTPTPAPSPEPLPLPEFVPQFELTGEPLWGLPDEVGNQLAWTVDDGASPEVVQAYANFAEQTGTRLTFFVNGM